MDYFSRSMRMVQLARQKAAGQSPSTSPRPIDHSGVRSSTPINSHRAVPEASLDDISYTELVPFIDGVNNSVNIEQDVTIDNVIDNSFSCYFPTVIDKSSILTRGNVMTNSKFSECQSLHDPSNNFESTEIVTNTTREEMADANTGTNMNDELIDLDIIVTSQDQTCTSTVLSPRGTHEADPHNDIVSITETDAVFTPNVSYERQTLPGPMDDIESRDAVITEDMADRSEFTDTSIHLSSADVTEDETRQDVGGSGDAGGQNVPDETAPRNEGQAKKRKADESKWIKVVNKRKREKGEAFMGRIYDSSSRKYKVVEKPGKVLGDRCGCKTSGVKCSEVLDDTRSQIFKDVWSMSWPQREILVKSLVHKNNVGRHRVEQSESSRHNTLKYNLNIGAGVVPVCKKMFLRTTGMTQHFITSQICNDNTVTTEPKPPTVSSRREAIKAFLASLPSMPAHYSRKSTSKTYFDRSFDSKMEVYKVYKEWCKEKNTESASRQVFIDELDSGNYAIFRPRKDLCDVCESYKLGNVDEATYTLHRLKKEEAQKAKSDDKMLAANSSGKIKMISMDLQAVLLSPALKASALYYRTKLCVHNFTIFDATTRDVCCYVWHEAEGGLTANEFASSVCHYIANNLTPACDELIIYSDGCPYQNRNTTLSKALTYTAQNQNITITHKYLEKGHTQMEVDSVHHTIEQKIKNKDIYSPSDYIRYMKEARQNPFPYRVEYLDHTFFKNYNGVCGLKSIRPGKKAGDPQVVDIRCLQYTTDGRIMYKLTHEEAWQTLFVRGNSTQVTNQPAPLLTTQRKITAAKYKHLQELKVVVPKDLWSFYDSLPHE